MMLFVKVDITVYNLLAECKGASTSYSQGLKSKHLVPVINSGHSVSEVEYPYE